MTRITEAIFTNGTFKPSEQIPLRESQRVRLIVQTLDQTPDAERNRALASFMSRANAMGFKSNGAYPARDELHERR